MVVFCGLTMTVSADGHRRSVRQPGSRCTRGLGDHGPPCVRSPNPALSTLSGHFLAAADGGVFAFGRAFHGSAARLALHAPIAGIASTPDGGGYWLTAADGGVFAFGDAHYYGRLSMPNPVVGIATTGDGKGYWVMPDTGGAFAFGDALSVQEAPRGFGYVAIAQVGGTTRGIALLNIDGTRYTFNATGAGCPAVAPLPLATNAGMVGITTVGTHCGEYLAGGDGGVFAVGAPFLGSAAGLHLAARIVGITS